VNLILNESEEKKYNIIEKVENGKMTRKEAKYESGLSFKQIDRLRIVYQTEGMKDFIHKNRGKTSEKKIDKKIIEELEQLYLDDYYDYNFVAFFDELNEKEKYKGKYDISYLSLYNAFLNDDIFSPIAHKGTIRLYNEKMNNAINQKEIIQEEKLDLLKLRQITFEKAHTRRSSNMFGFGQEVQMNACEKNVVWWNCVIFTLSS